MKQTKTKVKARQYLIDLHRWRSAAALAACIVTLILSLVAIVSALIVYARTGREISSYFQYFTTLSNMLTAFAAGFIIPFAINGLREKRFVYPHWLFLMHYAGTICTTMTFVFSMVFILPFNATFALGGSNLYLHLICPIMILIAFFLVESGYRITRKNVFLCTTPLLVYASVYFVMVVIIGTERGGWRDLYKLNTFVPFYISVPAGLLLAFSIAFAIRALSNRFAQHRQDLMLSHWKKDMDPVEVSIEIFGLGRHYGLIGDKSDLSIPYDLLEMLADRYAIDPLKLVKVYEKGLLDAVSEREAS